MPPKFVLIGPPGAGKSTIARALASELGVARRDTDADIEQRLGKSIPEIFIDDGEEHFRAVEQEVVAEALAEHSGVLALGGGAVMNTRTQELLRDYASRGGSIVFLDVSVAAAAPRIGLNNARPLLVGNPRKQWAALMEERRPVYEALATMTVSTDHLHAGRIAKSIAGTEQ